MVVSKRIGTTVPCEYSAVRVRIGQHKKKGVYQEIISFIRGKPSTCCLIGKTETMWHGAEHADETSTVVQEWDVPGKKNAGSYQSRGITVAID